MRSFWSEPFLWIHLAGLAAVPLLLELCCLGLAIGKPILPAWSELLFLAVVGILPVLWMQLQKPFYIFSILLLSIKPEQLTHQQQQILSLFKSKKKSLLAGISAIFSLWLLWQIYWIAPVSASIVAFLPQWRLLGLLVAALAFLGSNLFLQIPISVLGVMFTNKSAFSATQPLAVEQIVSKFTIPGWQVNKILPFIVTESATQSND